MIRRTCALNLLILTMAFLCLPVYSETWREDFNVDNGWQGEGNVNVIIVVENGFLDMRSLIPAATGFSIPLPSIQEDETWDNYTVKMRVSFVEFPQWEESGKQGIELIVRQSTEIPEIPEVGYKAGLFKGTNRAQDKATIFKSIHAGNRRMVHKELVGMDLPDPIDTGVWYDLKVTLWENKLVFQVENIEISATDEEDPFMKGGILLLLHSARMMIDYIEVSTLDVPESKVEAKSSLIINWSRLKTMSP